MGLIKANYYNGEEWQISTIAKAMAHPARKRIVELVLEQPGIRNADLPKLLNFNQTTVTQHLNMLYRANVIRPIYHTHYSEIVVVPETLVLLQEYLKEIVSKAITI